MSSADEDIRAYVTEFQAGFTHGDWNTATFKAWVSKYYLDDADDTVIFIRPSGNPCTQSGWIEMMESGDITGSESQLKKIDSVQILNDGNAAVVTYTEFATFSYKGTPNSDTSLWSAFLTKVGSTWKVAHQHRSAGQ